LKCKFLVQHISTHRAGIIYSHTHKRMMNSSFSEISPVNLCFQNYPCVTTHDLLKRFVEQCPDLTLRNDEGMTEIDIIYKFIDGPNWDVVVGQPITVLLGQKVHARAKWQTSLRLLELEIQKY
jgi:hypothetical protein